MSYCGQYATGLVMLDILKCLKNTKMSINRCIKEIKRFLKSSVVIKLLFSIRKSILSEFYSNGFLLVKLLPSNSFCYDHWPWWPSTLF